MGIFKLVRQSDKNGCGQGRGGICDRLTSDLED